jgi:hypothetical protein
MPTNLAVRQSCPVFYESTWPAMLNNPLLPKGGALRVRELLGFGLEIKPEVWTRPGAIARVTTA